MKAIMSWVRNFITGNKYRAARKLQAFVMGFFRAFILFGISYVILSPVLRIISNSVRDPIDLHNPLVYIVPMVYTLDNLRHAFGLMNFIPYLAQTLLYVLGITLLQVFITSMVGYGFARFRFPSSGVLFAVVILTIVIPIQTYMIPLYMQFRFFNVFGADMNLVGGMTPMIIMTAGGLGLRSGLYIYIFRQFFKGLPKEIEEASLIDGAGHLRTYLSVMLPNAKPAIITVAMFSFVWQYNDTFYSTLFTPALNLLPSALSGLETGFQHYLGTIGEGRNPYWMELVVHAGMVLFIAPIIIIYIIIQRQFMEGLERSGIVG